MATGSQAVRSRRRLVPIPFRPVSLAASTSRHVACVIAAAGVENLRHRRLRLPRAPPALLHTAHRRRVGGLVLHKSSRVVHSHSRALFNLVSHRPGCRHCSRLDSCVLSPRPMTRSDISGAHHVVHIMLQHRSRDGADVVLSTPGHSLNRYDSLHDVRVRRFCEFHAATRQREHAEPQNSVARDAPAAGRERTLRARNRPTPRRNACARDVARAQGRGGGGPGSEVERRRPRSSQSSSDCSS